MASDLNAWSYVGLQVIEDPNMTEPGAPIVVLRTFRERWFSRPWRPFRYTKTIVPQVPMRTTYVLEDRFVIMHPAMAARLRQEVRHA